MQVENIQINDIEPNPEQPRKSIRKIDELAASIKEIGLINPILVQKSPKQFKKNYVIISGERRWHAHKQLGKRTIPAMVDDNPNIYKMLAENLARDSLCLLEKVDGTAFVLKKKFGKNWSKTLSRVHSKYKMGEKEERMKAACKAMGIGPSSLYCSLSVKNLPESTKKTILENLDYFNDGVILKLSKLRDKKSQINVSRSIVRGRMSSGESMKLISRYHWSNDGLTWKQIWWKAFFKRWHKDQKYFRTRLETILGEEGMPEDERENFISNIREIKKVCILVWQKYRKKKEVEE